MTFILIYETEEELKTVIIKDQLEFEKIINELKESNTKFSYFAFKN